MPQPARRIMLVSHPRRPEAAAAAQEVTSRLGLAGIEVVVADEDTFAAEAGIEHRQHGPGPTLDGIELICILGGDGTILRAAEIARGTDIPLLGINLGHVGFLAEAERDDLAATVEHVVNRQYATEERMTLQVTAFVDDAEIWSSWALNEISVEKAARERMIDVAVEVDGRPLSTWGCDGVIIATPTGSTAYAFSAGGPIIWPDVQAVLVVPNSAHALFARPAVVGTSSHLAIEVIGQRHGPDVATAVLWCDGRRHMDVPAGARIEVVASSTPVRLARLGSKPFTDRLVDKFDLPVAGWRGAAGR